ncbi:MAG: DUF58 domain-containing protein [Bacteroidetes bacterium]|nr:DUF58 domain-containing protein [Bacteroidota bacterium]
MSMINRELIEPFSKLELLAKQVVEGFITGLHKSPFHGFSVEFAEHRIYNKGESTKHIDWKLFGKTDKLFIKRYEEETNLRCQIIIDTSNSMLFPLEKKKEGALNKLTFSIYAAAALMQLLKNQRDAIGITFFDKEIHKHYPAKSNPAQQKMMYHELEELLNKTVYEEASTTQSAKALDQVAEIIHKRSLVVIFSDMFEDHSNLEAIFASLQHLKYKKHDVVLFHVTDKKQELDFEFENRPHHFIDIETKQEIKLNPNQVKELYLKKITEYTEAIKLKCGQYKIDFVEADINQGFDVILQTYLVKRGAMLR